MCRSVDRGLQRGCVAKEFMFTAVVGRPAHSTVPAKYFSEVFSFAKSLRWRIGLEPRLVAIDEVQTPTV